MDMNSLSHSKWECKYHVVFAPKFRRKVIYGQLKQDIASILSMLCKRKGVEIIEAEMCPDHVHMLVRISFHSGYQDKRSKGDDLKDPRDELYDNLKEAVNGYANVGQILKTAPYNSTKEAMKTVILYDDVITDAAKKYDVEKEMIQSVLFQEIRFYGLDDPIADELVKKSYEYETKKEIYELGGSFLPPIPVIGYRTDSSTGLGQIFAKTAIEATNWYQEDMVYDYSNIEDRKEMWFSLQNNSYNIDMIGMVLAYKRECIKGDDYTVKDILKAYNGSGQLAEKYSDVAILYYDAFRQYNLAQNCDE